ncbi:hypothetical protein BKA59DRAFT_307059 [Fusarium tricinctum]|uniref:Uncharacterized protein n=1 Tax=Fusarium tricinctum TaxID=61284 RepID=A0A8K0RPV1_9HYPO|nr:hypothetical protein BKA59DRAFT_307059 [Fusarium tricinctum]
MPELTKRDAISYHLLVRWMHGPGNPGHATTPCCCVHKRRNIRIGIGIGMKNSYVNMLLGYDCDCHVGTRMRTLPFRIVSYRIVSSRQCAVGGPVRSCSRRITDHTSWIVHNSILIWANNTTCVLYPDPDPIQPRQFVPCDVPMAATLAVKVFGMSLCGLLVYSTIRVLRRQYPPYAP